MILQITSNASSDLTIKGDGKAIIRGNEGVFIMGKTVEFKMGGDIELKAVSTVFCCRAAYLSYRCLCVTVEIR